MATHNDPDRTPVVVASGQSIERDDLVTPIDLMARAADAALADAPALRTGVDRVSVVSPLGRAGPAPASQLAERLGLGDTRGEVSSIGGNTPQWLVNRAASAIAAGELSTTLIVGAEALRSSRARRAAGAPFPPLDTDRAPDPVVGDDRPGLGPAEGAIGLMLPVHIYPMLESAIAARAGHDTPTQRRAMGTLLAPFTEVAAAHPFAWFRERHTAQQIATPSPDNRVVAEPYTKRMSAFLGSDQGAALLVCSLAAARRAGVADRAVFVWAGAETADVFFPSSRPEPGRSPAIAAAGRGLFAAAGSAAGRDRSVGIDDVGVLDLYSCFPSAVEAAAEALGLAVDDGRGLTVTGGLPYFGGPGNNFTTHAVATLTDRLRDAGSDGRGPQLGLATGLGWFVTKHALGLYATEPPPGGFRRADTAADQEAIDATAVEVALEVERPTPARVLAVTVARQGDSGGDGASGGDGDRAHEGTGIGPPAGAPAIVRLPDGRQMAVTPADEDVLEEMGRSDVLGLVGTDVLVEPGAPRYRLR
jgi:acetyl-CoA C-acetyltransferase